MTSVLSVAGAKRGQDYAKDMASSKLLVMDQNASYWQYMQTALKGLVLGLPEEVNLKRIGMQEDGDLRLDLSLAALIEPGEVLAKLVANVTSAGQMSVTLVVTDDNPPPVMGGAFPTIRHNADWDLTIMSPTSLGVQMGDWLATALVEVIMALPPKTPFTDAGCEVLYAQQVAKEEANGSED